MAWVGWLEWSGVNGLGPSAQSIQTCTSRPAQPIVRCHFRRIHLLVGGEAFISHGSFAGGR